MATTNKNEMITDAVILTIASVYADTLWVLKDPHDFLMSAFVKDNKFVQLSHANMEKYLTNAGVTKGTLVNTPIPFVAIKSWPSKVGQAKLRPMALAEALPHLATLSCMNDAQGRAIKEEQPSVATFAKKKVYDCAGAWIRLSKVRQDNTLKSFVSPMFKDPILQKCVEEGDSLHRIMDYIMYEYEGVPNKNCLLHGVPSSGKTVLAQAVAAILKMPYAIIAAHGDMDSDTFGGYITAKPENGLPNFELVYTKFLLAAICGAVIVIDEGDMLSISNQKQLNNFLWSGGHITIMGKDYYRHPDTVLFITCNTGLAGDQPFLNAFETRLRQFLIPALTLEERVYYWHRVYKGKVTKDYLEAFVILCDTLSKGLNSPKVQQDDDRHPDGTAFNARGHLTMLGEWLRAKDTGVSMTTFVTEYMRDVIGNIERCDTHLSTIMGAVTDKILHLESLAGVAFVEAADTDEGIDSVEFDNILSMLNAMPLGVEEVEVITATDEVVFTFRGGRFGTESIIAYNFARCEAIATDGPIVTDDALRQVAMDTITRLMGEGIDSGIHPVDVPAPVVATAAPKSASSLTDAAAILAGLAGGK